MKNYFGFDIDINVSVLMRFVKQIGTLTFGIPLFEFLLGEDRNIPAVNK